MLGRSCGRAPPRWPITTRLSNAGFRPGVWHPLGALRKMTSALSRAARVERGRCLGVDQVVYRGLSSRCCQSVQQPLKATL